MLKFHDLAVLRAEKKRLISPSGLELSEEQSEFVYWAMQWVYDCQQRGKDELLFSDKFRLLTGFPGTGKSTGVMTLIAILQLLKFKICLAAPTHQVKDVLIMMASENKVSVPVKTIHSLMGLRPTINDDGDEVFVIDEQGLVAVGEYDLIVVDECSMNGEEIWGKLKNLHDVPLVLCMGDIEQLRPVKSDKKSLVFTEIKESFHLSKILRFEGAIAQYVDAIRRSMVLPSPIEYANGNDLIFCNTQEWFLRLAHTASVSDSFRAVAYTNKNVEIINTAVRRELWRRKSGYSINPDELKSVLNFDFSAMDIKAAKSALQWEGKEVDDYLAGDKVIFKKPFSVWSPVFNSTIVEIPNGVTALITRAEKTELIGVECYALNVEWTELQDGGFKEVKQKQVYAIAESEKPRFAATLNRLKGEALSHPKGRQRSLKFRDFYNFKNQFVDIQHHYASTVHKAIGTTFDTVFVYSDMNICPDRETRKELVYVASSRAKQKLIICLD
jgi:exodeoxyribonuclease-5